MRQCSVFWITTVASIGWATAGVSGSELRKVLSPRARPHGLNYSLTLHDVDGLRLLGYDNAHGIPRSQAYDHRHRFRRTQDLVAYDFRGADELICDFFDAVERACEQEGAPFEFESDATELGPDEENDDDTQITD